MCNKLYIIKNMLGYGDIGKTVKSFAKEEGATGEYENEEEAINVLMQTKDIDKGGQMK